MTGKQRMQKTLRFEQPDRPPHFEIMFELEREAFGLTFPDRDSWAGLNPVQKERAIDRCMEIYERIIERYQWDALAVYWPWSDPDGVRAARKHFGDRILVGSIIGHTVLSIEGMDDWTGFSIQLFEEQEALHVEARSRNQAAHEKIDELIDAGAEFIHLVNDVAFNHGPFISPEQFAEFVTPYLAGQVRHIKERGAYAFVHSDGNIMPLLDQYLSLGADLFQSIDPMAGMDIAEVKRRCQGKMALMGNVQCSLLQDGPREAIRESARYCLERAAPGGGYVFSTSNTIFPGMPLGNYEYMLEVYRGYCREFAEQANER